MSRFARSVRIAVAGLLAVSALTVFGASPASAAATGSLANDGNGGLVVTYSGTTPTNTIDLEIHPVGTNCDQVTALALLSAGSPNFPPQAIMAASPATIVVGTTAFQLSPTPGGTFTVAATAYKFCLFVGDGVNQGTLIDQLTMTIGQATPITTTAPAADPVAPSFTG
jgi:hypothetical protein